MPYHAGGYDWLAVWRRMYDDERAQADAVTDPDFERHADQWATRAARFATAGRRAPQPDGFLQLLLPRLRPTDTVLDVGAGAGRYLPLLSRTVARVVALEPSEGMRAQMERRIAEEGLHNVELVADWWPTTRPIQADVVISAHVVYAVREIGPFLTAMHAAAKRACYLYLGLTHPTTMLAPFWKRFRGDERLPLPGALEALNALHQLGFCATMELVPITSPLRFADAEEALHDVRQRLRYAPDPQRDQEILAAIDELLLHDADGSLSSPQQPSHAAVLWWTDESRSQESGVRSQEAATG